MGRVTSDRHETLCDRAGIRPTTSALKQASLPAVLDPFQSRLPLIPDALSASSIGSRGTFAVRTMTGVHAGQGLAPLQWSSAAPGVD